MISTQHTLKLNGFTFAELFHAEGLHRLDQTFLAYLNNKNPALLEQLKAYRQHSQPGIEQSEMLIATARVLENFLAELFHIEDEVAVSEALTTSFNPISIFKKYFVLKRAKKEVNKAAGFPAFVELNEWLQHALTSAPVKTKDQELSIALLGQ